MTAYTVPAPHETALPARSTDHRKVIPHVVNRLGALAATAGLALAMLSLYLPWLGTDTGSLSAIGITEVIDVRSVVPLLFFGLVMVLVLVAASLITRLGALAAAASATSVVVLLAHIALMWTLYASVGTTDPTLSGLPASATVSWGPYVAAVGFLIAVAGSAWAARAADFHVSDL